MSNMDSNAKLDVAVHCSRMAQHAAMDATRCNEHNPHAEASPTFVCYGCRR